MNFPGLDFGWTLAHRSARGLGVIQPWDLEETKKHVASGDGVLVVANTALGDTLLCTPLLQTLADTLGPKRVGFLVRESYADLYKDDSRIGHLFTVPGKYRGFGSLRSDLLASDPPFRIALIANCTEPDLMPWLWWSGVRGFLRYRSRWSAFPSWFANRDMLRRPSDVDYASSHAIENNLAMAQALGLKITATRLSVDVHKSWTGPERLVVLHPGASREEKRWALENWCRVAIGVAKIRHCQFAITGSVEEQSLAIELAAKLPFPVENWAGKLSLSELAARLKTAALFLSGDTGPYHLAIAVNCPTVTLFAPRDRGSSVEACGPYAVDPELHHALQTEHFGDSIATLTPQKILDVATRILEK